MPTNRQLDQANDPQLAALEQITKLLAKIDSKLSWVIALIVLAMLWTFLNSLGG